MLTLVVYAELGDMLFFPSLLRENGEQIFPSYQAKISEISIDVVVWQWTSDDGHSCLEHGWRKISR